MRSLKRNQREIFDLLLENCTETDEVLQKVSEVLKSKPDILQYFYDDMTRNLKNPQTGRPGLTAEQVLCFHIIKFKEGLSFEKARDRIADSLILREFCGFKSSPVPKKTAFVTASGRLREFTIESIHWILIEIAWELGLETGEKFRIDATAVESNIRYPLDNELVVDFIETLTRLSRHVMECFPQLKFHFPSRLRRTKKRNFDINRSSKGRAKSRQKRYIRELINLGKEILDCSEAMRKRIYGMGRVDKLVQILLVEMEHYEALGRQVIDQYTRRVFKEESVPASEKVVSIFEEHADIVVRGKVRKPVEFGHKVLLSEGGSGLVTQYRILPGNPSESLFLEEALSNHHDQFERFPELVAADRGFSGKDVLSEWMKDMIENLVIPQKGYKTIEQREWEKSKVFREGSRFRNGIEGRISVLKRVYGLSCCTFKGEDRFYLYVGLGVVTHNLFKVAQLLVGPKKRKRKKKAG